jgi:CO dehydrogenase nickel-insertion accessory protein CooC1
MLHATFLCERGEHMRLSEAIDMLATNTDFGSIVNKMDGMQLEVTLMLSGNDLTAAVKYTIVDSNEIVQSRVFTTPFSERTRLCNEIQEFTESFDPDDDEWIVVGNTQ